MTMWIDGMQISTMMADEEFAAQCVLDLWNHSCWYPCDRFTDKIYIKYWHRAYVECRDRYNMRKLDPYEDYYDEEGNLLVNDSDVHNSECLSSITYLVSGRREH